MRDLLRLYKKFNKFCCEEFSEDVESWLGVSELELSKETIEKIYNTFHKESFIQFCTNVRDLLYAKNPFEFITSNATEIWDFWCYLSFLVSEGLAEIKNRRIVADEALKEKFIPRYSEKEILYKLYRKFGKVDLTLPTTQLVKKDFKLKPKLDQLPISIESAVSLIAAIFKYYPLPHGFLFVGDDDFISVISSAIEPKFLPMVADLDEDVLQVAKEKNEKILTFRTNFEKKKSIGKKILGFCTNPPYTEKGVKTFLTFGMLNFGKLGGRVFLQLGDEAIGRKLLLLQEFFVKNNLEVTEIARGKIRYPFMMIHEESRIVFKRLLKFFDEEAIKKNYMLGADLYVLTYIPWQVKHIKTKSKLYSYI